MQLQAMLRLKMGWIMAQGEHHETVLSSRVRLARNIERSRFPSHASRETLRRVLEEAFAAARRTPLKDAAYLRLAELDALDHRFLVERHLISPALASQPQERGVVVGEQETISLMVNEEDHLRLSCLSPGLSLEKAFRKADALDDGLAEGLEYAFRGDWGYLTACPTNLGTGLRASCLVHLPGLGLAGRTGEVLEGLSRLGLIARGLYGEGTKVMGDFFQIANATALGRTEGEILRALEKAVGRLVELERESREALASGPDRARLEDTVLRSIGLLTHARLLSFEEACQHLSALRLGLALGWKVPGDIATASELMILAQPAHLQMLAQEELAANERDLRRSSLIRERLGGQGTEPSPPSPRSGA